MSELIRVSNITNFQGFSTGSRKAVDNPAALRALSINRFGGGGIPGVQPPPILRLLYIYLQCLHQETLQLFSFSLRCQTRKHLLFR